MEKRIKVAVIKKAPEIVLVHPPKTCQVCGDLIKGEVIDGRTLLGAWAYMCPKCHSRIGKGIGVGIGQRYENIEGRYIKTAG